jgi:tRNA pseudouridine55 synthase
LSGIVIINKGEGITSQGVVKRVSRLFAERKAGHTGTLDPLATGVLPVLVGRAVKASEYMLTSDKYYRATLRLGLTTDTEDITGNILTESDLIPCEEEVMKAVDSFVGKYLQTPPMYSALKIGGKKLCDLAREGVTVEREAREVEIFSIECKKLSERDYSLDVHCSKGTYIRTLCADIGKMLGCGGIMKTLLRKRASVFTLSDSLTLSQLEALTPEEREARVIPTERVFLDKKEVTLPDFFARLARAGQEIYLKKIGLSLPTGELVRLSDKEGFFALGEVREFENGNAIKPIRQF